MSDENSKYTNTLCAAFVFLFVAVGCKFFAASKTEEVKRGRLKYVQTLRWGNVGNEGGHGGWYVDKREFTVNGKSWSPKGMDVTDALAGCEASPNEKVEALKCDSFDDNNETVYVLQMKNDKPDWATAYKDGYIKGRGNSLGEWVDDGKSLIFKDYFYHIQTGEKQEIKGLPDYPARFLRGVSPDLKTIVYQSYCFDYYAEVSVEVKKNIDKICADSERFYKNKIEVLWLIEAATGETKFVEISRDKYDWLLWNKDEIASRKDWLDFFQKQIVWEKDQNGKYQLVYPK